MTPVDRSDVDAALDHHVDPVNESDAYRGMLLGLLGDDDPGRAQAEVFDQLAELLKEAGPNLRRRPAPGEWSALEVLAHMVDAEVVLAGRYRWILAHDEPPLIGYDQDLWVQRLHGGDDDPEELLAVLAALRRSHLQLWKRTPEADRSRVGIHTERGPESFELSFRLLAGHDRFHLGQMRRTLEQVSSASH